MTPLWDWRTLKLVVWDSNFRCPLFTWIMMEICLMFTVFRKDRADYDWLTDLFQEALVVMRENGKQEVVEYFLVGLLTGRGPKKSSRVRQRLEGCRTAYEVKGNRCNWNQEGEGRAIQPNVVRNQARELQLGVDEYVKRRRAAEMWPGEKDCGSMWRGEGD